MNRVRGLVALAVGCACGVAAAGVTSIEVRSVRSFADGAAFGAAGAYERVTGVARGELDPQDPRNRVIRNLDLAPRNARGRVEYDVDFDLLRPVDPARGNGRLFFDVTNRGRKYVLFRVQEGRDQPRYANDPLMLEDAGDALFLRQGWTIAWTGWDPDAPTSNNGMSIRVPVATEGGRPIVRTIREELVSATRGPVLAEFRLAYEVASTDASLSRLTVRRREADPRVPVAPDGWTFSGARTLRLLPEGTRPQVGSLYELHYPARNPRVLGIGFAATRDVVSFLRHERIDASGTANPAGPSIRSVIAFGVSQSGRYLRDHVSQGFNQDERGRKVFDGVLSFTAGAGRVFLNEPFGQPARTSTEHQDHLFPENAFPFSTAASADPASGRAGALLRGDGFDPLLFEVNTSTEYWQKGASLVHTDPAGTRDLQLPPTVRAFLIAGTQHGGRAGTRADFGPCMNPRNPHNPAPVLRALLVALDAWASEGRPPPASRVPQLAAGTLVPPDNARFPVLADFVVARHANEVVPLADWIEPAVGAKPYRVLVPATDADGNETAGLLLPDIAVPLATHTGWNLYKRPFSEGALCDRDGSYREFAATPAARAAAGDLRPSLAERYGSHAQYVERVRAAARRLVEDRLLLAEDAEAYVRRAQGDAVARRFDAR